MSIPATMPLNVPVKVPVISITGLNTITTSMRLIKMRYARNSWVILWKREPIRLMPTGPNNPGTVLITRAIETVLITPPPKLSRNAGPRNVPVKNEPTVTRISVIVIPVLNPYRMRAVRVIILARPKRSHGIGVGMSFSKP